MFQSVGGVGGHPLDITEELILWGCGELFAYWTEEVLLLADQELLPGDVFKHSSYSIEELIPSSEINL